MSIKSRAVNTERHRGNADVKTNLNELSEPDRKQKNLVLIPFIYLFCFCVCLSFFFFFLLFYTFYMDVKKGVESVRSGYAAVSLIAPSSFFGSSSLLSSMLMTGFRQFCPSRQIFAYTGFEQFIGYGKEKNDKTYTRSTLENKNEDPYFWNDGHDHSYCLA